MALEVLEVAPEALVGSEDSAAVDLEEHLAALEVCSAVSLVPAARAAPAAAAAALALEAPLLTPAVTPFQEPSERLVSVAAAASPARAAAVPVSAAAAVTPNRSKRTAAEQQWRAACLTTGAGFSVLFIAHINQKL